MKYSQNENKIWNVLSFVEKRRYVYISIYLFSMQLILDLSAFSACLGGELCESTEIYYSTFFMRFICFLSVGIW